MAGGKISPRQKMINLMYLVFIAMLAMNMSKEVLSAFGFMNEKLNDSNLSATQKNNAAYDNLATKASEQKEKFGELNEKAKKIKGLSSDYYSYLAELKSKMTADLEDKKSYESMDKTDFLDNYFFKGDQYSDEGKEFVKKMNSYRDGIKGVLGKGYESLKNGLDKRFNTAIKTDKEGNKIPWLEYHYKGFPLVASLTNMTQIQADVKNTETDVVTSLLGGKMEESLSLSNYKGIVALDKNAYFSGEKVKGKVVLGRYDATMVPDKVTLNGKDYKNIKDGQVIIDMPAGSVGNKNIKGSITFTQNGKPVEVPFESTYSVISQPGEAVISADKMNVVYRGLQNPISVSLPGVPDKDIRVSGAGKRIGPGKYLLSPKAGKTVTINVSAKLSSGKNVSSKKVFRVKDIPAAVTMVDGKSGNIRMPRNALATARIGAGLPDFMFDLKLKTLGYKIKVPGQITVTVSGNKLSAKAKKTLSKARRGDVINIYEVRAQIVGNAYKIKRVLGATIELTN